MDQFTPQTPFDWIGLALVIGVVLRICWALFIDYCERQPIYDPMRDGPEDPAKRDEWPEWHGDDPERQCKNWQEFVGQSFSQQSQLHALGAAQADMELAVQRQMAADTMKGTKQ